MAQELINLLKVVDTGLGTPASWLLSLAKSKRTRPDKVERILVNKWIGMGDVVVTLPALKRLREKYPNAKIDYLTHPRSAFPLKKCGLVDEIHEYNPVKDSAWQLIKKLRANDYDLVIDLEQRYRFSTMLLFWSNPKWLVGFRVPGQGRGNLFDNGILYPNEGHEAEKFGKIMESLGCLPIENKLPNLAYAKSHITDTKTKVVIHISVGPALLARKMSADTWNRIVDMLPQDIELVITGTSEDANIAEQIQHSTQLPVVNTVGKLTLDELCGVFDNARLVISSETGPMHLAAASKAVTIGLFPIGDPNQWKPFGEKNFGILAVNQQIDWNQLERLIKSAL